jgi:hypothetical protein
VVFNTIGDKPITATYSGDINYLGSTDLKHHTVNNPTTTVITSDNNDASVVGEYVTVIVKVSGLGTATPGGNVAITGADANCTDYSPTTIGIGIGEWSCDVRFDTAYARIITATYSGDGNYAGSSDTEGHMVNKGILTEFTVTVDDPDPSAPNQLVQESVFVQGAGAMPTGTVVITINSGQSSTCTIHLVGGGGSCNISFDAPGPYTITYTYSGDGNYWPKIITDGHTVSTP